MGFAELLAAADQIVLDSLGAPVVYTPGTGSAVTVQGIFDRAYVRATAGHPGISTSGPAVFLTLSTLPTNPAVDTAATITYEGVVYAPFECSPDGIGGTLLHLHETG